MFTGKNVVIKATGADPTLAGVITREDNDDGGTDDDNGCDGVDTDKGDRCLGEEEEEDEEDDCLGEAVPGG